jgi:hypothetical protein
MSAPSWIRQPKAWGRPSLANIFIPGFVLLRKIGLKLHHTKGKASGKDFGKTYLQGSEIPDFEFDISIVSGEDEDAWNRVEPIYMPRVNPQERKALSVSHPMLQSMGIYSCIPVEIEKHAPISGSPMRIVLKCIASMPEQEKAAKTIKYSPKKLRPQSTPAPFIDLPGANFANSVHEQASRERGEILSKPKLF